MLNPEFQLLLCFGLGGRGSGIQHPVKQIGKCYDISEVWMLLRHVQPKTSFPGILSSENAEIISAEFSRGRQIFP